MFNVQQLEFGSIINNYHIYLFNISKFRVGKAKANNQECVRSYESSRDLKVVHSYLQQQQQHILTQEFHAIFHFNESGK
ncbi:uncharacterized protein MONOS_14586 [Monocercomonoides exilis]|uniref:uncharacterized protein n=1 Tax=Monocercomonoides exilis TaxID=2049356 RepID=UPI00355A7682|nr:hypothetical protein MONOS_14586 [Monocercomonoides exilis]|eukprot:MONOS_14586.1-p1 / transcript=MONOS_14586.1 / gene=MONOS_14586 / organism=Monocercomonoides_exilis_PA203 / gene_product=unspecified product / transcript_product=unspecified product / location=Mono_scaffold01029:1190-1563(+) / protein_length=79 / sequence_SO=supercontig / SO=protein_coding / is_pseudo=false